MVMWPGCRVCWCVNVKKVSPLHFFGIVLHRSVWKTTSWERKNVFFSNEFLKFGSFYYQFCLAIFKFTSHENAATDTPGQNLESTQLFSICGDGNNVASFVFGICVGTFGINNIFDILQLSSSQPRPSFLCSQMHPESRAQRCTLGSRSIASLQRRAQRTTQNDPEWCNPVATRSNECAS